MATSSYLWVTLRDPTEGSGDILDASLTDAEAPTSLQGRRQERGSSLASLTGRLLTIGNAVNRTLGREQK